MQVFFLFKLVGERSQDMIIEGQLPLCVLIQFGAAQTVINVLHVFADMNHTLRANDYLVS